ncbi:MAG: hypothetical protein ACI8TP_002686 [Acidimicrobiales bacterium]|jgi:hypothetical protein
MHQVWSSVSAGGDGPHSPCVEVVDGLVEFLGGVHHERPVTHHWFVHGFPCQKDTTEGGVGIVGHGEYDVATIPVEDS